MQVRFASLVIRIVKTELVKRAEIHKNVQNANHLLII